MALPALRVDRQVDIGHDNHQITPDFSAANRRLQELFVAQIYDWHCLQAP
jgi:hypothetical protein